MRLTEEVELLARETGRLAGEAGRPFSVMSLVEERLEAKMTTAEEDTVEPELQLPKRGLLVTMEDSPENTFIHHCPSVCWDLVRDRVNQEILKQRSFGNHELSPFQFAGTINGLEMFGFLSPSIIQMIESLDGDGHRCEEYWASKKLPLIGLGSADCSPHQVSTSERRVMMLSSGILNSERVELMSEDEIERVLETLFHRASPEELLALHRVFRSGPGSGCWGAAFEERTVGRSAPCFLPRHSLNVKRRTPSNAARRLRSDIRRGQQ
ncbi:putative lysine-specific demethylase JMJ14 [Platanthera guangdongensis]|uniref:Lysine-specific demethylase JMJ14 n=1 Tax=Platanthera guangdongensis TaxID=2320717 RepID=A0ABR2LWF5_9ASPA